MSLRVPLQLHPDSRCDALRGIEVEVARSGPRRLQVQFVLLCDPRHIRWAAPGKAVRTDGLWRGTCLELFLRAGDEEGYVEFNLTPAGRWAAYRFRGYREGMEIAHDIDEPLILGGGERRRPLDKATRERMEAVGYDTLERFEPPFAALKDELRLDRAAWLPLDVPWRLGLAAVIEERSGRISYWALRHPPGEPDFHDPDCFTLELPAARPA